MAAPMNTELEEIMEMETLDDLEAQSHSHTCKRAICLHKRVCTRFAPCRDSANAWHRFAYCCCGRMMAYHSHAAQQRGRVARKADWHVETDTDVEPTDAHGVHSQVNASYLTRYVRVDYATDMSKLLSYMNNEWQMAPANFLITLIGSTSPVYLRKKMRSSVQRSLVRLIESCDRLGGWLLASGAGVTDQLSAVLNEQLQQEREVLHVLTLQPWGTLQHSVRKTLVEQTSAQDSSRPGLVYSESDRNWQDPMDTDYDPVGDVTMTGRRGTSPCLLDDAQLTAEVAELQLKAGPTLNRQSAYQPFDLSFTQRSTAPASDTASRRISSVSMASKTKYSGAMSKRVWFDKADASHLNDLPANHPFVLLVDSGQLGPTAFGTENCFRQRLEVELTSPGACSYPPGTCPPMASDSDRLKPACYVLFAGGPRSTKQVQYALARQIPVVVLQGTGKMADILALACNKADEEELDPAFVQQNGLPDRLRVYFRQAIKERVEVPDEASLNSILSDVERCMAYHHLLSVYSLDAAKSGLDVYVLHAMLNVRQRPRLRSANIRNLQRQHTVDSLAVEPEAYFEEMLPIDVDDMLSNALRFNHVDCARLVLDRTALRLRDFLTIDRLGTLYMPDNLKSSTFKSLLVDRRLRDARWLAMNDTCQSEPMQVVDESRGKAREEDVADGSDSAVPPAYVRTPRMHPANSANADNRADCPQFNAQCEHTVYCPLTLAGKVITRMLGSYFHSPYLHFGHHLKSYPEALLASGQFKPALEADWQVGFGDSTPEVSETVSTETDRMRLFSAPPSSTKEVRPDAPGDVLGSHFSQSEGEQMVLACQAAPVDSKPHLKRRNALTHTQRNALSCSGKHWETVRVSMRKHAIGGRQSLSVDALDGTAVEKRIIPPRFRFIGSEECAALHLFVWCVLQMRIELAMLLWQRTNHKMAAAFVARLVLQGLLKAEKSPEMKERMRQEMIKFERLALGILNVAYDVDIHRAQYLLLARLDDVAQMSTIQLAARADCKNFIAHPACTGLLDDIWCGRISPRTPWHHIVVCIILPILIPFLVVFRTRPSIQKVLRKRVAYSTGSRSSMGILSPQHESAIETGDLHFTFYKRLRAPVAQPCPQRHQSGQGEEAPRKNNSCSCFGPCSNVCNKVTMALQCLVAFYSAPKTIFAVNTIFYVLFLLLFSYTMLFAFTTSIQHFQFPEWAVCVCMISLTVEEVRQLLVGGAGSLQTRLRAYFSSGWNQFDFACLTFFYIGCLLAAVSRVWCSFCTEASRILITISLMILYLRLLNIFSVHQILGPKLVMLGQMIRSVVVIFIMIGVFVIAYGVAAQSILYPNLGEHDVISVIGNATMRGYFAMFGELGLSDIEDAAPCDSVSASDDLIGSFYGNTTELDAGATDPHQAYCTDKLAKYTVPVLLAIHVVMTNLVLFNVLIATFNFIFTQIDDQTDEHWRFNMYHLIEEYRAKPPLAPPFILIWHLLLIVLAILEALPCCRSLGRLACYQGFRRLLTVPPFCCETIPHELCKELSNFEDMIASRYQQEQEEATLSETEAHLTQVENAVKDMSTRLTAVHDVVIATDYNTELIRRDGLNSGAASATASSEGNRGHHDLHKLVQNAIDIRVKPIEDKLNLILSALAELKLSKQA